MAYYDEDERQGENLVSKIPLLDESNKLTGRYDKALNQESHPVFEEN